jgi:hypothetical protein
LSKKPSREEIRRSGAYHEAAHAVVDMAEGHTVRYVSIETEGTDYRDICVTSVDHCDVPGVGLIPAPWQALGHAISTIAGNVAMWREFGKTRTYPWDSWEKIMKECAEIEELGDPDELECDTTKIREYCEAAALFGQTVKMPTPDEVPEGAPPPPPSLRTAKEAYEVALERAEHRVNVYWPVITNVAEKLMEVGYLTGEQVEEIVDGSELPR